MFYKISKKKTKNIIGKLHRESFLSKKKNDGHKHQLFQSRFLEEKYIKQNYLSGMTPW